MPHASQYPTRPNTDNTMSQVTTADQADENIINQLIDDDLELERRVGSDETGGGASNGFVSQQPTPNQTVLVSAIPAAYSLGSADPALIKTASAPYTSPAITASTGGDRLALLTVNSTGGFTVTYGTTSTGPLPPTYPSGEWPLALIYLRQSATGGIYNTDQGTTGTNYIQWDVRPTLINANLGSSFVTSAMILNGTIVNADISTGAAIAYSKLNLSASVVSGDIVDGTLVNADVSSGAAIAPYKINHSFLEATGTSYALSSTDFAILANPSSNQALTLPATSGVQGSMLRIKRWSTDGTVTLHAASSSAPQLIDGSTSFALTAQYQAIDLLPSTGRGWGVF